MRNALSTSLGLVWLSLLTACGSSPAAKGASHDSDGTMTGGSSGAGVGGGTGGGSASVGGSVSSGGSGASVGGGSSSGGSPSGGSPNGGSGGGGVFDPGGDPPELVTGEWVDITPSNLDLSQAGAGVLCVSIDPSNTAVLYICLEGPGIWKSTDAGTTWGPVSDVKDDDPYDNETTFLDLAINILVDPNDSNHLYATEGVRGANNGFWVSTDAGQHWSREKFRVSSPTDDFTTLAADPADFNHVIIGSHSCCEGHVMESTNAGDTWNVFSGLPQGSFGLGFLHNPGSGTGDASTWRLHAGGIWRTSNAGQDWAKVSDVGGIHGATEHYYTADGTIYSGAEGNPLRSTDNGLTWEHVDAGGGGVYPGVIGDGNFLYTFGDNFNPSTCKISLESDGTTWTPLSDQMVPRAPLMMRFDPVARIIYSANWDKGLWALKVQDP